MMRVMDGQIEAGQRILSLQTDHQYEVAEVYEYE